MKKYFALFLVLIAAAGFNIGCVHDAKTHQNEVSMVDIPITISVFHSDDVFVAAKDSEQVPGISMGMGRVLVEWLGQSGQSYAVLSVFVVPNRKISMGTHLIIKQVNYRESSNGARTSFLFVE